MKLKKNRTKNNRINSEGINNKLCVLGYWFYNELYRTLSCFFFQKKKRKKEKLNWMCHTYQRTYTTQITAPLWMAIQKPTFSFCQRVKSHFKYLRSSNNIIGKDETWETSMALAHRKNQMKKLTHTQQWIRGTTKCHSEKAKTRIRWLPCQKQACCNSSTMPEYV